LFQDVEFAGHISISKKDFENYINSMITELYLYISIDRKKTESNLSFLNIIFHMF
jgi:hypothetical protein